MMMRIGSRIFKTAIGAGLAMYIAQWLGLNFYSSAGIIAILCIETTKMRSLKVAMNRGLAGVMGILFGGVFFTFLGYTPITFALLILVLLPVLIKIRINSGFVTSVVILIHIFNDQKISLSIIENELALIAIGVGVALLLNSFMPNLQKDLGTYQRQIESNFKKILYEYAEFMEKGDQGWDGAELFELERVFNEAKSLAIRNVENHLLRKDDRHYLYFEMREKQFDILHQMLPTISQLDERVPQRKMFAQFLSDLSAHVKEENTAYFYIDQLKTIREDMRELPLPETREEFETRAKLHHLMNEMSRYLEIKKNAKWLDEDAPRKMTKQRRHSQ